MIETGDMDAWLWWLNTENTKLAEENPAIGLINAYGLYNAIELNPLNTTDNFNIFSIKEVREAMNWIIDRTYIVNDLWAGRGSEKFTYFKSVSPDYARTIDAQLALENEYAYDFEKGKAQIYDALETAGAYINQTTSKWYYKGKPIVVNCLIRIEDERLDTGDYVASQLEKLGLTTNLIHRSSGDCYLYWGVTAPSVAGDWHFYTAGWISTAMTAYDDTNCWSLYQPDNMPLLELWQPSPILIDAYTKLNDAQYQSMDERNTLVEQCSSEMLKDGLFDWYIDQEVSFPYSLERLNTSIVDLYGGDHAYWYLKFARGNEPGGSIKYGAMSFWIEGFNPVGGFNWLYDVYAQYIVEDEGVYFHPHSGIAIPHRADFMVETAGPTGTEINVPSDALMYDVFNETFYAAGPNVTAKSKVTYNFTYGKWHHMEDINQADVMYGIAECFKVVTPGTTTNLYDVTCITPERRIFTSNFKGIKWLSDTVAEVYTDYWHPDKTYIAYYTDVWPPVPWEGIALANKVVSEKQLAWSTDQSDIWGVDMLDLIKGTSLPILKDAYDELAAANYIPPELANPYVTESEATARWAAKGQWYNTTGNWWVSNGPYSVDTVNVGAYQITFKAFRSYPFKADAFDSMIVMQEPEVSFTSVPTNVVPGLDAVFNLSVTAIGVPYEKVDMRYLLIDPSEAVMKSGTSMDLGGGAFSVELSATDTAAMTAGSYKLLTVTVGEEYAVPTKTETVFTVVPELAYFQTLVADLEAQLDTQGSSMTALETKIDDLTTSVTASQNTLNYALGIGVLGLLVGLGAVVLSLRKK
jgi:peptide/nickel transport system substrate-binding protein